MHSLHKMQLTMFDPQAMLVANYTSVSNISWDITVPKEYKFMLVYMTLTIQTNILEQHKIFCYRIHSGRSMAKEINKPQFVLLFILERGAVVCHLSTLSSSVFPSKLHSFSCMPHASLNILCISQSSLS